MRVWLAMAVGVLVASAASDASAKDTPWLGVIIADSVSPSGARIIEVIPGTPADDAGIVADDIITHVGDKPVFSASGLISRVTTLKVGEKTTMKVVRTDTVVDLETTLSPKLTDDEILRRRLVDKKMPAFSLPVLSGTESGSSADHAEDVMLIMFTSPVCRGSCQAITDAVEEMRVASAKHGLAVLGVMPRTASAPMVRSLVTGKRLGVTMLKDSFDELRVGLLKANAIPAVLVVDRRGFIRYAAMGNAIDVKDLRFAVSRALGKTASR